MFNLSHLFIGERAIEQLNNTYVFSSIINIGWTSQDPFKNKNYLKIKDKNNIENDNNSNVHLISEMEEYINSLFDIRKHDVIEIINRKNLNELKMYQDNNNLKEFSELNDKYFNIQKYCCSPENQVPDNIKNYIIYNYSKNRKNIIELSHKRKFVDIKKYVTDNNMEIKSIDDEYFNIIEYCRSNDNIPDWMTKFIISHYTQKRYKVVELIRGKKVGELLGYMNSEKENSNDGIEFLSLNDENFDIVEFCKDEDNKVTDYMKNFIISHLTEARSKVVELLRDNNYKGLKSYTKNNKLEFKNLNDENFNIFDFYRTSKTEIYGRRSFSEEINDFMLTHYDNDRATIVNIIKSIFKKDISIEGIGIHFSWLIPEESDDEIGKKTFNDLEDFVNNHNIKFKNINDENFDIIKFLELETKSKEITTFIFKHFDDTRSKVIDIIERYNTDELKSYTLNNLIILKDLNDKSFDILNYAFNANAPNEMIDFIINQRGYDFSNYNKLESSPYYLAFSKGNIELVDLLYKYSMNKHIKFDINQHGSDIIKKLNLLKKLNKKTINYLINHGYKLKYIMDSINELLNTKNNELVLYIFKKYIFDNAFILSLLYIRKERIQLNKTNFNKLIMNEKNKYKNSTSRSILRMLYGFYSIDNIDNSKVRQLVLSIEKTGKTRSEHSYNSYERSLF